MRAALLALAPLLVIGVVACDGTGPEPVGTVEQTEEPSPEFTFVDISEAAGLTTVTWCGRPNKPHLLESGGTGLALLDYDGDGDLDLYLVNGWRLDGAEVVERGRNALYRNRGDATFEDVTDAAGVGDDGWGCGVAVGDIDGDGHPDLFVTNFGTDVLLRNRGDGTFERVADAPGVEGWSAGAVFFDADDDGDDDLFVTGYIECTLDEVLHAEPTLAWKRQNVMFGPFGLEGLANAYFVNDGEGRFTDATKVAGLEDVGLYYSFVVAAFDMDDDRDLDLYVANDSNPNYVYVNDGDGAFQETGLWSGAALGPGADAQAGMGIATGDYDRDGRTDLLVTNFAEDCSTLYRNTGAGLFEEVTRAAGLYQVTFLPLSWGTTFSDFDLDGDLDLFIANGHIYPQADDVDLPGFSYGQTNILLRNDGGRFTDVSADAGSGLSVAHSSRGVGCGDLDGDGDLDLVIANVDAPPTLLRNDSTPRGAWLVVDAPGARKIVVTTEAGVWTHDVVRGGSFCSAHDPRVHFGLGDVDAFTSLVVHWPDGEQTELGPGEVRMVVRVVR